MKIWVALLWVLLMVGVVSAEPFRLVFIGPPGAGKGTQAKMLSKHFDIPHISTGAMLRDHIKRQTPVGKRAEAFVSSGALVPDQLIVAMLRQTLAKESGGFILDGFPRNVEQAKILKEILHSQNQSLSRVVFLRVPDEVVIERLSKRGRKDDKPKVIKNRLNVFRQKTAPVINYYAELGNLLPVSGEGNIQEVQSRIRSRLQNSRTWMLAR